MGDRFDLVAGVTSGLVVAASSGDASETVDLMASGCEPVAVPPWRRTTLSMVPPARACGFFAMTSYLDHSDSGLLSLVLRSDADALGELFRRYATVVLVAAGWSEEGAESAEHKAVAVFLDVWLQPARYEPGAEPTRSHLIRAALLGATEAEVQLAASRLAQLEGWTYHDVAEVLARPARQVALGIRSQLTSLRREPGD